MIPDNNPNANPRGMAIRFHLAERVHTDIISHSADGFPTRTGQEFLEFLRAVASTGPTSPSPSPIEVFLGSHPAALAYVGLRPNPSPASFATQSYFGVTAVRFLDKARSRALRPLPYRSATRASNFWTDAAAQAKDANYLMDELAHRVGQGPIRFDHHGADCPPGATSWTMPPSTGQRIVRWSILGRSRSRRWLRITRPSSSTSFLTRFRAWTVSKRPPTRYSNCAAAVYLLSGRARRASESEKARVSTAG